jgi:transposase-like protein
MPVAKRLFRYFACRILVGVEQDHRAIKRIVRPMLGFKDFRCARIILGGIELMHMIAKGQMNDGGALERSAAEQFYGLAT